VLRHKALHPILRLSVFSEMTVFAFEKRTNFISKTNAFALKTATKYAAGAGFDSMAQTPLLQLGWRAIARNPRGRLPVFWRKLSDA